MFRPIRERLRTRGLRSLLGRGTSDDTIELEAPGGPVRATRDENGYPSIVAHDRFDAAWAKGWFHAQDRLAQVLLTRMAAQGRLLETLGELPMARTVDRAVRMLRLPLGVEEHVRSLGPTSTRLVQNYCDGFAQGRKGRVFNRLLGLAGIDVGPITAVDVLRSYRMTSFFGLTSSQQIAEMIVGELVHDGADEEMLRLLMGRGADGIDIDAIRNMRVPEELALLRAPMGGSNAFAVTAERSGTGGALLMSEPHLEVGNFPPTFYATHEIYPDGQFMQGLSVPGTPWLVTGRTRDVGWSYTYGHADNVDVLIERCSDGKYLVGDDWVPLSRRIERVKVRGGTEELWTYWDNEYGTIQAERAEGDLACVRWAGLHESTAEDIDGIVSFPECDNIDDLAQAHRSMHTISLAVVMADRDGRIGWMHTGRVDERPEGWTGAYPQPGWTHDHEPPEHLPESARPWRLDPEEGFVVSANEYVEGAGGERWVNFPEPRYRFDRLHELVEQLEQPTLRDFVAASYDEYDRMAERLAPIWAPLLDDRAFDEVLAWATSQSNRQDDDARSNLGLFHALHHELIRALLETKLSPQSATRVVDELALVLSFQHHIDEVLALETPDQLDEEALAELLKIAWPRAQERVRSGEWNTPIRSKFKSIFTQGKLPPELRFSTEEFDFPGGPVAPFQSRVMPFEGEQVVGGPAYHLVFDMSEDGAWYHIAGGASEFPWGPGYGTGVDAWRKGRFTKLGDPRGEPPNLG